MKTKPLTNTELSKLYENLSPRDRLLVQLGTATGFRISELLSLRAENCGLQVTVSRKNMKGKMCSRSVPINSTLQKQLAKYVKTLPPGERLFPISRVQAWRVIKQAAALAKVQGTVATHSMRKTFAKRVHEAAGRDLFITQQALGHANINSTVKYLQLNAEQVEHTILAAQK